MIGQLTSLVLNNWAPFFFRIKHGQDLKTNTLIKKLIKAWSLKKQNQKKTPPKNKKTNKQKNKQKKNNNKKQEKQLYLCPHRFFKKCSEKKNDKNSLLIL